MRQIEFFQILVKHPAAMGKMIRNQPGGIGYDVFFSQPRDRIDDLLRGHVSAVDVEQSGGPVQNHQVELVMCEDPPGLFLKTSGIRADEKGESLRQFDDVIQCVWGRLSLWKRLISACTTTGA